MAPTVVLMFASPILINRTEALLLAIPRTEICAEASYSSLIACPENEDRHRCELDHFVRHAAHEPATDPRPAVRRHHHQVSRLHQVEQLPHRRAIHDRDRGDDASVPERLCSLVEV